MKRQGIIVFLMLLAVLGLVTFLLVTNSSPNAPRYVPGKALPVGNYRTTHYNWDELRPFVADKVWIFGVKNSTNGFNCLYDLRQRMILGDLQNAGVVLVNGDHTKLLVDSVGSPAANLKESLLKLLQRVTGGKFRPNINRAESFWLLQIKDNTATRVGSVVQYSGTGSRWYSSSDMRYGCTAPTTENGRAFVLFDFDTGRFTRISVGGQLRGWWDDQHILLQADNHDFVLYNVSNRQTAVLFSAATVQQTLAGLKLPSDPTNVVTFANWNGREYDFYFTGNDYEFRAKRCFILKAERTTPTPTLKLITLEFQFAWGGTFNTNATLFLYQGESGAVGSGGDGAVYLRNLRDNSVRTLVPPDHKGQYSIPRFYGDEVIYYRNRVLWRIGLDGSNNVPLFSPTNSPANP